MEVDDAASLVDLAGRFIPDIEPDPFPYTEKDPGPYKTHLGQMGVEIDGVWYRGYMLSGSRDVCIAIEGRESPLYFQDNTPWNTVVYHIRKAIYERDKNG